MTDDAIDALIRRVIGGDRAAITSVLSMAGEVADARAVALAGLLAARADWLARAGRLATTSRDRQIVAIGESYLRGELDRVDALARDHLTEHPDSLIVAWLASGASRSTT